MAKSVVHLVGYFIALILSEMPSMCEFDLSDSLFCFQLAQQVVITGHYFAKELSCLDLH
jgi:hypothetical protein